MLYDLVFAESSAECTFDAKEGGERYMAYQTVVVLNNNTIDEALGDPDFIRRLKSAIDKSERTGQPARIGGSEGHVMPSHHGYDPKLYLSYGGILEEIGETTVKELPHSRQEIENVVAAIVRKHVSIIGTGKNGD